MLIDWWTLGIQAVNVLILVWILARFFWRPVARMIEQRRAMTQNLLADATAKRSQAAKALADIEKSRAGIAEEREQFLKQATENAEKLRGARLQQAEAEAAALEQSAKTAIERERKAIDQAWTAQAGVLAVDIAQRLARRLDGPAIGAAFTEWLIDAIRKMPESERRAAVENGATLDAVSAAPLEPADQDRLRSLIAGALGANPPIRFTTDPALIAGLELHGQHLVIANSWRADLQQILADLGRGGA